MTDLENRLDQLLRQDIPPARDAAFRIAVLAGIERRRLRMQVALLVVTGLLSVLVLWGAAPQLTALVEHWTQPIAALGTAAALAWASILAVRHIVRT